MNTLPFPFSCRPRHRKLRPIYLDSFRGKKFHQRKVGLSFSFRRERMEIRFKIPKHTLPNFVLCTCPNNLSHGITFQTIVRIHETKGRARIGFALFYHARSPLPDHHVQVQPLLNSSERIAFKPKITLNACRSAAGLLHNHHSTVSVTHNNKVLPAILVELHGTEFRDRNGKC